MHHWLSDLDLAKFTGSPELGAKNPSDVLLSAVRRTAIRVAMSAHFKLGQHRIITLLRNLPINLSFCLRASSTGPTLRSFLHYHHQDAFFRQSGS